MTSYLFFLRKLSVEALFPARRSSASRLRFPPRYRSSSAVTQPTVHRHRSRLRTEPSPQSSTSQSPAQIHSLSLTGSHARALPPRQRRHLHRRLQATAFATASTSSPVCLEFFSCLIFLLDVERPAFDIFHPRPKNSAVGTLTCWKRWVVLRRRS